MITLDKPDIAPFVTVGLNATTNALEQLTRSTAPLTLKTGTKTVPKRLDASVKNNALQTGTSEEPIQAVFVCRADGQPSQLHAHFPLMCVLASTEQHPVFLIQLPKGAERALSERLAVPRVGFVGLKKAAPGAEVLFDYISKHMPVVRRPGWLEKTGEYIGIKPKALHTVAGIQRPKGGNKGDKA
jgi:ribonuclease P/MRP protein subunit POP3